MYIISQMPLCRLLLVTFTGSCLAACATRVASPNRSGISSSIEARTGHGLRLEHDSRDIFEEISLDDGVTEDEAVAIALWNNAAFQADLATLGFARADLIEAGLLRNPILSVFFPLGPKQLESTATWPIEAIWQRPRRVAAATFDAQKVAENLVKHGLDLARDVRGAHAEVLLTQERLRLAEEAMRLRQSIARITDARLRAGDISMLETNVAVSRSRMAEEQAQRFRSAVAPRGLSRDEIGLAGFHQPALRARRRSRRRVRSRGDPFARFPGRIRDRTRHRGPQRHHAGQSLPSSGNQ